jgi:hypothetical protein
MHSYVTSERLQPERADAKAAVDMCGDVWDGEGLTSRDRSLGARMLTRDEMYSGTVQGGAPNICITFVTGLHL